MLRTYQSSPEAVQSFGWVGEKAIKKFLLRWWTLFLPHPLMISLGQSHPWRYQLLSQLFWGSYTSTGRKFALVEGVSHDLVCAGSNYHVHFAWQVWHGQYSPGFKFNKLKSFSRVEIDRTHVDLKDSRGKGFALRRLNKHNFCPASVLGNGLY